MWYPYLMRSLAIFMMMLWASTSPQLSVKEPADIKFELATKNGRKVFRIGEAIDVEFRLTSTSPMKYQAVDILSGKRLAHFSSDRFVAEPSMGVSDPLGDFPRETMELPGVQFPGEYVLGKTPAVLNRRLNDWLTFQKPGHYRVTAETGTISSVGPTVTMIPLGRKSPETKPLEWFSVQSNAIEIDLIAPEAGWAEAVLHDAVAKRGDYYDTIAVNPAERDQPVVSITAQDALRFLQTREAAMAMIQLNGQSGFSNNISVWSSVHRFEIVAALRDMMMQLRSW